MALVFADLVQENTSTTGTGTLTLTGAVSPQFQTFAAIGDANTTYYRIISGNDSENGLGTYTLSGTTLSRDTVLKSIIGGVAGTTKITVAAGATVICTYPAEKAVLLDAANNLSLVNALAVTSGGTGTTTPAIVAGANITVSGTWPNQTIASSGGGGGSTTLPFAFSWFMSK